MDLLSFLILCSSKLYEMFDVFIKYLEQFLLLKRLSFFHVSSLSCSVSEEMCAKPSLKNLITSATCHWDPTLSFKMLHFINGNSIHFIKGNHYQLDVGIAVFFFFSYCTYSIASQNFISQLETWLLTRAVWYCQFLLWLFKCKNSKLCKNTACLIQLKGVTLL